MSAISVDSFRIRIPFELVTVINPSLYSHWIEVNADTGETRDSFKSTAYLIKESGISTRYEIKTQVTRDQSSKTFLIIGVNAKMLQGKYLEGITLDNVGLVYEYLIAQQIASFTYDSFINGECTDVDFKKDFKCDNLDALINKLAMMTVSSPKVDEGCRTFTTTNLGKTGIEWSHREATNYSKSPFLKVYSKEVDLKSPQRKEFRDKYMSEARIKDLTRVEYTIKNKKHFRSYGINQTDLNSILSLSQDKLQEMLQSTLNKHTNKPIRSHITTDDDKINTRDQKMINVLNLVIDYKIGVNEFTTHYVEGLSAKERSRAKQQIDEVWVKYFSKLDHVKELNKVEDWLKIVGVVF